MAVSSAAVGALAGEPSAPTTAHHSRLGVGRHPGLKGNLLDGSPPGGRNRCIGIEAAQGEFIANDRGLAMWDPNLPAQRGNAWASSPQAETTVPVGPGVCLKITPSADGFAVEQGDKQTVDEINLRTYGWADKAVFGRAQDVVEEVHRAAEANPSQVPRPKVPPVPARPGT